MSSKTYSFQDVTGAITGPGGTFPLSGGIGAAEEGITVVSVADKNEMLIGADGQGQHSLMADESATCTVRLLKTSLANSLLQTLYNYQTRSSLTHGQNTITIRDAVRGDLENLTDCAFKKNPDSEFAAKAGTVEWVFDCIRRSTWRGVGTPEI